MATGTINFPPQCASPSDGSASNAAPGMVLLKGTEANPKKNVLALTYDATGDEHAWFTFVMPANYASGGAVDLLWSANATSGTVRWGVALYATTSGDADTFLEHAPGAASTAAGTVNATEARRVTSTPITIANLDSVAAGDYCVLLVYRDADGTSGTDDCSVDAELLGVRLTYTTT